MNQLFFYFLHSIFYAYFMFECSEICLSTSFVILCDPSVAVDNTLKLWYTVWRLYHIMQSNPDTAPPSLSGHDCLRTELIIQYFNLLTSSIQHHKLQWTNSGTVSGFNCISFQCCKVGSDQHLQVTAVIRCYVMTTYTYIFPEVTGSLIMAFKLIRDQFSYKTFLLHK
jgi:hypothetical protein